MDKINIQIETEVNPTEAEENVKTAVARVFSDIIVRIETSAVGSVLIGQAQGKKALVNFRDILRRDRVRDAARKVLYSGYKEESIVFFINKQVAYAGHVSFSQESGESPLGPIKVVIECENPRELIAWLTT